MTVRLRFDWQGDDCARLPTSLVLKIPSTEILAKNIRYTTLEEMHEQHDRLEMILKVVSGVHLLILTYYRIS